MTDTTWTHELWKLKNAWFWLKDKADMFCIVAILMAGAFFVFAVAFFVERLTPVVSEVGRGVAIVFNVGRFVLTLVLVHSVLDTLFGSEEVVPAVCVGLIALVAVPALFVLVCAWDTWQALPRSTLLRRDYVVYIITCGVPLLLLLAWCLKCDEGYDPRQAELRLRSYEQDASLSPKLKACVTHYQLDQSGVPVQKWHDVVAHEPLPVHKKRDTSGYWSLLKVLANDESCVLADPSTHTKFVQNMTRLVRAHWANLDGGFPDYCKQCSGKPCDCAGLKPPSLFRRFVHNESMQWFRDNVTKHATVLAPNLICVLWLSESKSETAVPIASIWMNAITSGQTVGDDVLCRQKLPFVRVCVYALAVFVLLSACYELFQTPQALPDPNKPGGKKAIDKLARNRTKLETIDMFQNIYGLHSVVLKQLVDLAKHNRGASVHQFVEQMCSQEADYRKTLALALGGNLGQCPSLCDHPRLFARVGLAWLKWLVGLSL